MKEGELLLLLLLPLVWRGLSSFLKRVYTKIAVLRTAEYHGIDSTAACVAPTHRVMPTGCLGSQGSGTIANMKSRPQVHVITL